MTIILRGRIKILEENKRKIQIRERKEMEERIIRGNKMEARKTETRIKCKRKRKNMNNIETERETENKMRENENRFK